jgi:hypothetical protein
MKHAQPSGSEAGHFTVMDLSPRGSDMITISSDARLGTAFTGTKAEYADTIALNTGVW